MERGLVLRQHFFGARSDEVWRACKTVGEMCNLLAMTYLQQEDFGMVLELLKKAEILTERDDAGRAVTFNNLACYYRRQGKLHASLQYLQKALKIEGLLEEVDSPADTHLNMCAVLSQLGRHQAALEHAQAALILLQEELFNSPDKADPNAPKVDRVAVLAIAYHNLGVEQEFLKKYDQSIISYRKGVEMAQRHLGSDHGITVTLMNSTIAARRAIAMRMPQGKELVKVRHLYNRSDPAPTAGNALSASNTQGLILHQTAGKPLSGAVEQVRVPSPDPPCPPPQRLDHAELGNGERIPQHLGEMMSPRIENEAEAGVRR